MTLGQVISQYRAENNISLGAFAKKAGISKTNLYYLENNKNPCSGKPMKTSLEMTLACCRAMNMDILHLLQKIEPQMAKASINALRESFEKEYHPVQTPVATSAAVLPDEIPPEIRITNESVIAAANERRLLILKTRIPRVGELVYFPMREYMMAVAFTVREAGGGLFRAEAEVGSIKFSIFDLDKTVFLTRTGAANVVRKWVADPSSSAP